MPCRYGEAARAEGNAKVDEAKGAAVEAAKVQYAALCESHATLSILPLITTLPSSNSYAVTRSVTPPANTLLYSNELSLMVHAAAAAMKRAILNTIMNRVQHPVVGVHCYT